MILKMKTSMILMLGMIIFACTNVTAQTDGKQDPKGDTVRFMYTPKWEKVLKRVPKDQKKWQDFELFARMYAKYAVPEEKILPIVFNVIDIGGKRKISDAMIYEQIEILNNAFAGKLEGSSSKVFDGVKAGDSKIKFCVGSPNGKNAGISYLTKAQTYDVDQLAQISDKKTGIQSENKDNYINIWITEMPDSMAGFAVLPGHDQGDDGIYIDPDFFASKRENKYYNSGKTLVHFVGRYLGLKPLYTDLDCTDDGVQDTPIHNAPNDKCYPGMHISMCSGYPQEMVGNFMDSNPDDCAYMFTKGQVARMHATLSEYGYRVDLKKGSKLCDAKIDDPNITVRSTVKNLEFELVPNPAQTVVEIQYAQPDKSVSVLVEVTSMSGQKIYSTTIPPLGEEKGSLQLDISSWLQGQYFVTLKTGKEVKTKKLLTIK